MIDDFTYELDEPDGIIEPGEIGSISYITFTNRGGMPSPMNSDL